MVRALLEYGADKNALDANAQTPAESAASTTITPSANYLIEQLGVLTQSWVVATNLGEIQLTTDHATTSSHHPAESWDSTLLKS